LDELNGFEAADAAEGDPNGALAALAPPIGLPNALLDPNGGDANVLNG
jgi:hypothetical protein